MANYAHDLFLLSTNLSQFKSKVLITKIFVESINTIFSGHSFYWSEETDDKAEVNLQVCTRFKTYGFVSFCKQAAFTTENFSLLQNAVQWLAILLEKLELEKLLNSQKEHLDILVKEKTKDLLESQKRLQTKNEEYETINEELQQTNDQLLIAKEKAEASELKLIEAQKIAKIGSWDWNMITNEVWWSEETYRIFGLTPDEFTPDFNNNANYVHPEDIEEYFRIFKECIETGKDVNFDFRINPKTGNTKYCNAQGSVIYENNKPIRFVGTLIDITDRKQAEEALRESESQFRSLFDNAADAIFIADIESGIILNVNQTAVKLLNSSIENIIGKHQSELHPPEQKQFSQTSFQKHLKEVEELITLNPIENIVLRSDGTEIPVEVLASKVLYKGKNCIMGIFRDITDRKRTEESLANVQKLESLGVLAGGIAHDFNNLLTGIFGYVDMAQEDTKETRVAKYLSKAMSTIDRARALTGQLLTFAKGGAPIQKIGNLFPFVEETAMFALSGSNVACSFDVPQELWACNFDKNQIGQVIDNLIINAQQAMPVGGTIELTARNITLSEKENPILAKGNYVRISIKDAGIGISKEFLAKIFDPFFTTKAKGHGLGLATCYSIVNRHGGCIDVESELEKGTTFKVYLPAAQEAAASAITQEEKTHKGSGTFLIMDDEEVVRDTIGNMLESFGYAVIGKENGRDAIDCFLSETKANRQFAGMIFDLTVPGGMGGKAAIEEIRKVNSKIPVFVVSGYADDLVMRNPAEYGFTTSICKPFRKNELVEILERYLKLKE